MFRMTLGRRSRRLSLCVGLSLSIFLTTLGALEAQEPPAWTLPEALQKAFAEGPVPRALRAELDEVESELLGAKIYPYNPELALELADRSGSGTSSTDGGLSLSQELEVAGQRRKRIAVASEEFAAAEATYLRASRLLAFRVESTFAEAVRDRELLGVAEIDVGLAREVLDFSKRRLERGAATQIEVNLAQASAGRAERSAQRAQAAYASARSRLAEVVGLDPTAPPEPLGELGLPEDGPLPLAELLQAALEGRGDLRSARRLELAAEADILLARADGRPNLRVGAFLQREESTDDIFGATVGVSLPLFNRNQGRIAGTRAARRRLLHQQKALHLAVEQEVTSAWTNLVAARSAVEHLEEQVLGTLEANVDLLQRSFAAGKIGATEVLTLRREFIASRREYVEALADVWQARLDLDLATGRLTIPQLPAEEN